MKVDAKKQNQTTGPALRVFICNDHADRDVRAFIERRLKQAIPSAEIMNPVKDEPFSKEWLIRTQDRIRRADMVLTLVGERSWLLNTVEWELTYAAAQNKRIIGLEIHPDPVFIIPTVLGKIQAPLLKQHEFEERLAMYAPKRTPLKQVA